MSKERNSEKKIEEIDLNDPNLYENRELSWLEFNQRVLDEANNSENPLMERVKFLSIVSSNLDEFFMVRVASLKEQVIAEYDKPDFAGMTPRDQLKSISKRTHKMVKDKYHFYKRSMIPALKANNIIMHTGLNEIDKRQEGYLQNHFEQYIFPVITPMAVDSSRPFPLILNQSLNIAVLVKKGDTEMFATVQVPSMLSRYIEIPSKDEKTREFVMLDDVIEAYLDQLFLGYEVMGKHKYRITRNSDLTIDEEEAEDLLVEIEKSIKQRKWGDAIRLEIDDDVSEQVLSYLQNALNLKNRDIYKIDGPLDLTFLMKFYGEIKNSDLKFDAYTPQTPADLLGAGDLFEAIKQKDIFLHHPFESFEPVVELIQKAAKDYNVLAIKQTLYRVSGSSPIIAALAEAAELGKQVTVLVELKARFDEENNIQWARSLEKAGCHVIYGLVGLKTHSKVTLIVRKEEDGIVRYVHLGTGNYNDTTAKLYTDMGLLTTNEYIARDVSSVFNALSGYSEPPKLKKIIMAPTHLRDKFISLIRNEAEMARQGKVAKITCKMNSVCDFEVAQELYKASMAGVEIDLTVRGICNVIPGIPGISENITIRSIIGKYLEHSRIYIFHNNGDEKIYLSSADWMPRNLDRRVELLFLIESEAIRNEIRMVMDLQRKDIVKAKLKQSDGSYKRIDRRGKDVINSQEYLESLAVERCRQYSKEEKEEIFVPRTSEHI